MKTRTKVLILALAAILLVVTTVFATVAFLTSQDAVTNTFTVGKVKITLDETDVDSYGAKDSENRVKENAYKLIPGHEYIKDPTVHVAAESEKSYVFVVVTNGVAAFEVAEGEGKTLAEQIAAKGWTAHPSQAGVYYKVVEDTDAVQDLPVFDKLYIASDADFGATENATVSVKALAIQYDGFEDNVAGAYDAVVAAYTQP